MATAKVPIAPTTEPPGPATKVRDDNPLRFLLELIREYGDVVRYPSPYGPVYFFNHPDHVQSLAGNPHIVRTSLLTVMQGNGLLTSEGEFWRSQRRLMQPIFHDHCMPAFGSMITERALAMLGRWEETAAGGKPLDFALEMRRLTLEVIVQAMFSMDLGSEAGQWTETVTTLVNDLGAIATTQFNMPLQFSPARNARFKEALQFVNQHAYRMIAERRAMPEKPRDLLSVLLQARDEKTGEPLSDLQVRDEIVTMLISGHETTAIALAWTWHLALENPAVEQRMIAEVDSVLQGRVPTYTDVDKLCYNRMVLEESLRLYPPVAFTARQTAADTEIGGYRIPAKTLVLLSAYTTHRHPDFWEEPDRFDPERFSPERNQGRHRWAYLPFFGSRHQCIGQSFAMLEAQLITALLLQRYTIRGLPGHVVEPRPEVTLRMRNGLMITAEKRAAHDR